MPTKRELFEENEALRDILEDVKTRLNDLDDDDEEESEEESDDDNSDSDEGSEYEE
jgi:hypothetical protein